MTLIDQYESVFKAADKAVFEYRAVSFRRILVVTDLTKEQAEKYQQQIRAFLQPLDPNQQIEWTLIDGSAYNDVSELLDRSRSAKADLICTYRHLHSNAWHWPYSLGVHLDVLTQITATPVLVLPHPQAEQSSGNTLKGLDRVMAITDHLTGDDHLVNFAARFVDADGALLLTHIEDQGVFERYMEVIGKIPNINTELAREELQRQLLQEPHDYIRSCREVMAQAKIHCRIEEVVTLGHHLPEYQRLIEEHQVGLLVMNTKEQDQLAMHGMAYSLAVELRNIPLLML